MKNLFFCLIATCFLNQLSIAQNDKPAVMSSDYIVCSDFQISASYLGISVSTTVYMCCGGIFMTSLTLPCSVVPKRTYDLYTNKSPLTNSGNGIAVSELFEGKSVEGQKSAYLDVTESSTKLINDKKVSIKKGRYPIDSKGFVYLEFLYQ